MSNIRTGTVPGNRPLHSDNTSLFFSLVGKKIDQNDEKEKIIEWPGNEIRRGDPEHDDHDEDIADDVPGDVGVAIPELPHTMKKNTSRSSRHPGMRSGITIQTIPRMTMRGFRFFGLLLFCGLERLLSVTSLLFY